MFWASRHITVIWKRRFNEHSMRESVFIAQPWLHRVSLKALEMNNEVTSMNFFLFFYEIYL